MVFCCGPVDSFATEEEQYVGGDNKNAALSTTQPQRRQFTPTNGNALIAGSPPTNLGREGDDLVSVTVPEGVSAGQTIAVLAPDGSRLVKATIPAGLKSGETFLVRLAIPIRPEVVVNAAHPFPVVQTVASTTSQPQFSQSLDTWTTPIDQPIPGTAKPIVIDKPDHTQPSFVEALDRWLTPLPATPPINDNNSITENAKASSNQERDEPPPVPVVPEPPVVVSTPIPIETKSVGNAMLIQDELLAAPGAVAPTTREPLPSVPPPPTPEINVQKVSGLPVNASIERAELKPLDTESSIPATRNVSDLVNTMTTVSNQKLLLVQVPPGLPAGATMQVEIPGENRTLAAIVPPGAEQFHIAYTPRTTPAVTLPPPPVRSVPPVRTPTPPLQAPPSSSLIPLQKNRPHSPNGQKLLLVRVPLGTAAGTTLHVSVPDEPGRILAAQVPPGNVQEFHVSYEARPKQQQQQPMYGQVNPYNNNPQQYYHPQQQQPSMMQPGYYHTPMMNNERYQEQQQQPNTGGATYWYPAAAAGMVTAAVGGMATYQQQQQNQYRDDVDDNNDNTADYNGSKDYELVDF